MTKRVIILRGISGSGKTTYRHKKFPDAPYVSSDDFFINRYGIYEYDRGKLGKAHNYCLREFIEWITEGNPDVLVVDNTNTRVAEIAPYYAVAECYGYKPEVLTLIAHPDIAHEQNKHGLTLDTVMAQHERLISEELPPWWHCVEVSHE